VPLAVSVVDTERTLGAGITDISGIADLVPGLVSTDGGSPSLGNLVIRGIYAGGAPTVGTYIDDVPYGGVIGSFASSNALDASLYDLEGIEISSGPQGTLFGAGAVAGVIRYVTKKPNLEEIEGYGFVDFSTTKDGGTNKLVKGRISAPIIQDKLAVSVAGYFEDAGGYTDLVNPGTGMVIEEDANDHEFWGGQVMVKAELSENFSLTGAFAHHEADFDSAGYESFNLTTGEPIFGADLTTEFEAPRALEFNVYSLTADIDFGFAMFKSITSYQDQELVNSTDLTAAFGPTADVLAPGGAPHTVGFNSGNDSDRFTQEFHLTSQHDGPLEWIIGGYYTKQTSNEFQITEVTPNDIELVTLNSELEYKEFALFGNVTFNITEDWQVTGGIRYSDYESNVDQLFTGALSNPLLNDLLTVNEDTVTTFLFNSSYSITDDMNIYVRAANGFRPGGPNLVVELGGMTFGEPSYAPDDLWSYEAGIKGALGDSILIYDVRFYIIDWNDAQISFTNPIGLNENSNALGGISAKGIEASLSGELFENFIISSSLAISEIELDEDEPGLSAVAGEEIPGSPDVTFSLAGDYTLPLGNVTDLTLGATFRHTGTYVSNYTGSPLGRVENDSYSQLDLRAGIQYDQIRFTAYVTNVTNSSAYQTIFHTVTPPLAYGVVLRPRTFGANLRIDF